MNNPWDKRYAQNECFYGEDPNVFFAEQLRDIKQGKLILPCEGEGRNAVYAASCEWQVDAFDSSNEGKVKATKEMLRGDFVELDIKLLQSQSTFLKEGKHHAGMAEVIRFVGVKINGVKK